MVIESIGYQTIHIVEIENINWLLLLKQYLRPRQGYNVISEMQVLEGESSLEKQVRVKVFGNLIRRFEYKS